MDHPSAGALESSAWPLALREQQQQRGRIPRRMVWPVLLYVKRHGHGTTRAPQAKPASKKPKKA